MMKFDYSIYMSFMFLFNIMLMMLMIFPSNLFKFHPLILSILLIFYVIILCLKLNYFKSTFWYSYILFLVMVGGLMILFMYFTSLSNNQLFYFNMNYYMYMFMKFVFLMIFLLMLYKNFLNYMIFEDFFIKNFDLMFMKLDMNMYKNLFMDYYLDLNLFLILYLFFTMICVVLICMKVNIPMRQLKMK